MDRLRTSPRSLFWWLRIRAYYWKKFFWAGERELSILSSWVNPRKLAVDVGGNAGVYTYHLSRLAKDVITFEPNPAYVALMLSANLRSRIEPVALSDSSGEGRLRFPRFGGKEYGGMASLAGAAVSDDVLSREILVPIRRLDDYELLELGFLKIDVEGHEEAVLAGARETIARCRPSILVEIEEAHNPGGIRRITELLSSHGYEGTFYYKGSIIPIIRFDSAKHQLDHIKAHRSRSRRRDLDYVNNFVFVPREF